MPTFMKDRLTILFYCWIVGMPIVLVSSYYLHKLYKRDELTTNKILFVILTVSTLFPALLAIYIFMINIVLLSMMFGISVSSNYYLFYFLHFIGFVVALYFGVRSYAAIYRSYIGRDAKK